MLPGNGSRPSARWACPRTPSYALMQEDRLRGVAAPVDAPERPRPNRLLPALWERVGPEGDVRTSADREHVLVDSPKSLVMSRLAGNLADLHSQRSKCNHDIVRCERPCTGYDRRPIDGRGS